MSKARHLRRILILDCCFAAAAFDSFQAGPAQVAITKTIDAFEVKERRSSHPVGHPGKGTTLLCSSDQKTPSLLLPDGSFTMFSKALLNALIQGDISQRGPLSLRSIKSLVADLLLDMPEGKAPKPVIHSPDQSEGDVADIPFFPNLYEKELASYEGAIQLDPQNAQLRVNKANILFRMANYKEALACYEEAIHLDPQNAQFYRGRARVLLNLGSTQEALSSYDMALSIDSQNPFLYKEKGDILQSFNRFEEALACYNEAIRLRPNFGLAYQNKGVIHEQLAKQAYETAKVLGVTQIIQQKRR